VSHAIFLGYTATNRNIIFRDEATNQIKQARRVLFDEDHYHRKKRPPYAAQLYDFNHKITDNEQSTPPQPIINPAISNNAHNKSALNNITSTPEIETSFNATPPEITGTADENVIIIPDEEIIEVLESTMQTPSFEPDSSLPHIIPISDNNDAKSHALEYDTNTMFKGAHVIPDNPMVHSANQEEIAGFTLSDKPYGSSILHYSTISLPEVFIQLLG